MPDGRFVAEQVQAKCASKYEAAPGRNGSSQRPRPTVHIRSSQELIEE